MTVFRNHYKVLGIPESYPSEDIPALRKKFARRFHPNGGSEPDEERLAQINESCDVLGNPTKRAKFDKELAIAKKIAAARTREARMRAARQKRARSASQAQSVGEAFQAQAQRPTHAARPPVAPRPSTATPSSQSPPKGRWSHLMLRDWVRLTSVTLALSFLWVFFFSEGFDTAINPLIYVGPPLFGWFVFFGVGR